MNDMMVLQRGIIFIKANKQNTSKPIKPISWLQLIRSFFIDTKNGQWNIMWTYFRKLPKKYINNKSFQFSIYMIIF